MRLVQHEAPELFHYVDLQTLHDGRVRANVETNDDDDDGWPGQVDRWTLTHPSVEAALKHHGTSRTGISGIAVRVYLDGKEVRAMEQVQGRASHAAVAETETDTFDEAGVDLVVTKIASAYASTIAGVGWVCRRVRLRALAARLAARAARIRATVGAHIQQIKATGK